ncbi:uncharacterized protein LOC123319436 isoform X2 [Coccinella septempunctata]|uniref:uncharacterized protein LOC123319436 isoform X2 n=1 Tax=Coccinella septempunctata TaxID=41139 RepID=UPI001D0981DC|nr:uncharacterized protein LOC123319436 isoform X2 [Coccinella septempunctata]
MDNNEKLFVCALCFVFDARWMFAFYIFVSHCMLADWDKSNKPRPNMRISVIDNNVSQILGSLQGSRNPKRTNILEIHQKTVEIHDSQFHPINSSSRKNFD